MVVEILGNKYAVSRDGHISRTNGKPMTQYKDKYGYLYILARRYGRRKKYLVHRLVAECFIPVVEGKTQVNHIDGNKENNSISNLEWVTNSENQIHSRYVLGNQIGFKDTPIKCIETGATYRSTRDAWRATGVCSSHISECASGIRKTAGGLHWAYERS